MLNKLNPVRFFHQIQVDFFLIYQFIFISDLINLRIFDIEMTQKSSEQIKEPLIEKESQPPAQNAKVAPIMSLFRHADGKDKIQLFFGTICALAVGCSFPFFMIFFGDIIEIFYDVNRQRSSELAFDVTKKFFIIGGATWLLSFIGLYCWNQSGSNQSLRFKKLYYKTLLDQQVAWYDSNDVNKLATEVATNISHIEGAIGQKCFMLITTITTSLFGFIYAYIKCWQLSLVLTGVLPFMMIAGALMMKSMANASLVSKTSYEDAAGRAQQAFGGIKTIKSLVGEKFEEQRFVSSLDKGKQKNKKLMVIGSVSLSFVMLIFLGVYALGFWFAKWLIVNADAVPGTVLGTFFCFIIGGSSIGQISPVLKNITEGRVAVQVLYDLMQRKKTLEQKSQNGKQFQTIQSIAFKSVNFSYRKVHLTGQEGISEGNNNDDNLVLENINIKFLKNKVNALVGESGSGKSTISQLLMRYYDPVNGEIVINDNTPLTEVNINNFRRKIGYVGQEPVLFAMSIEENIKLANPKLTEDEIINLLKKANAWEFVQKLQKGIKTYVGASGTQISGGQKQRIAIARAIAKNPNILILDEATSALDRKNEKEIQTTLKNLEKQNITTVVIAHRLSTIRDADKITVLSKGKIVQQGTHSQLIKNEGLYFALVKSQLGVQDGEQVNENKKSQVEEQTTEVEKQQKSNIKEEKKQIPKQKLDAVFGKLFKRMSKHNHWLAIGIIGALANGSIWPFFNIAFSNILSMMSQARDHQTEINNYCLLFLATAVAGAICTFAYKFPFDVYGQKAVYQVRKDVFGKLLRMPVAFYDKKENTPGAVSTKLATDAYQLHNMISGVCAVMCMNVSTVTISLIFAFTNSWQLTLIVLGLSPLIMVAGAVNMAVLKKLSSKTQQTEKFIGSLISDTVVNIRTVKSFGNNALFLEKYSEKLDNLSSLNSQKAFKSSFFDGMGRGMIMIVQGLTFWFAGMLFQANIVQHGNSVFIAIFSVIFAAMGVGQNSAFMPDMAKAKIAGASIFDILQSKTQQELSKQNGHGTQICSHTHLQGAIEFKNVTFKYPQRDAIILQNFSYRIQPNSKVAFVGPSGSGKSTITQILQRFYPLQSGSIQINGKNIQDFDLYSYRQQIGYVSQQPTLFTGTVKQNIKYNYVYSDEYIDMYADIAHAKKFIYQWDQKYEKEVGNKGSEVSGGQKQRIALIRSLMRKPAFFIFDQSTSALDMDTEKIVFENLKSALQGKTSISIAHRLATIEDSDKIIVMREGKIIEDGTYQELMQKREHFYRLAKGN